MGFAASNTRIANQKRIRDIGTGTVLSGPAERLLVKWINDNIINKPDTTT